MTNTTTYPKRPTNFAIKFIRRMFKVCLGNDITPDACLLLAFIASTEDAKHYRAAVTFWNDDLATRSGLSLSGMKRAREKAVAAGWLNYTPGTKGRAATYFVIVPKWADGLDDAPGDEQPGELTVIPVQGEPESFSIPVQIPVQGEPALSQHPDGIRTESGRNPGHILPVPVPVPIAGETPAAQTARNTKKRSRPQDRLFDAICEVTGATPAANGDHVGKVAAALSKDDPPWTPEEVREFGRRFHELCPLARDQRERPEIGELQKQIYKLRAKPLSPPRSTPKTPCPSSINPPSAKPCFKRKAGPK